jgi:ATP-dependent DNA ligase
MLQRALPAGFIAPCLPTKANRLPLGSGWLHEIEHDGFRVIARKKGAQVKLYGRPGNDLTYRFPLIVDPLVRPRSRSCCTARHSNSIRTAPTPQRPRGKVGS